MSVAIVRRHHHKPRLDSEGGSFLEEGRHISEADDRRESASGAWMVRERRLRSPLRKADCKEVFR